MISNDLEDLSRAHAIPPIASYAVEQKPGMSIRWGTLTPTRLMCLFTDQAWGCGAIPVNRATRLQHPHIHK